MLLPDRLLKLMDPRDRPPGPAGLTAAQATDKNAQHLERDEQRIFAQWCQSHQLPFVWHSTAHRTKASVGCPDFIVGLRGATLWIEFKCPGGKLSADQEDFLNRLTGQKITLHICHSASEAIELCRASHGD